MGIDGGKRGGAELRAGVCDAVEYGPYRAADADCRRHGQRAAIPDGSRAWYGLALAVGFGTFQLSATILPANVPNLVMSGTAEGSYGIHLNYVPYLLLHTPVLGILKGAF